MIRAERAHEIDVSRAAYTGDFGAEGFRDLHGVGPHAAGGAVDEHLLSRGDATVIAQTLQCGDGGDRDRGGLLERQFGGLQNDVAVLAREHVFGERAPGPAEDFVAGFESGDTCADSFHGAREIGSGARTVRRAQALEQAKDVGLAGGHVPLVGIEAGGVHLDQDLAFVRCGFRNALDREHLRRAITPLHDGAHGLRACDRRRRSRACGFITQRDGQRGNGHDEERRDADEDLVSESHDCALS